MTRRSAFWSAVASSGKASPAPISGSMDFGKTMSSTRSWRRTRFRCEWRGAIASEWGTMWGFSLESLLRRIGLAVLLIGAAIAPARAIEAVRVPLDATAIDLTKAVESYSSQGDRLLVSTAPGSDGIVRRIEVRAREPGTHPSWIVFALTNDTGEQIERLVVAPHFRLVGSGVIWPDLGASRISAITASQGFPPERDESADADVFRLTLDPGTTVTYIAELRTPHLPPLYLWG